jgi:hypothetical protein
VVESVLAELSTPRLPWWQPVRETDPKVVSALHALRMAFTRKAVALDSSCRPSPQERWTLSASWLARLDGLQTQDRRAQELLEIFVSRKSCPPEESPAAIAVKGEIFPYLPGDLSRYMYLTLLHELDAPRFNYPALKSRFSRYQIHLAIVGLATRLAWKLCLIDEHLLQVRIRGCVWEMSGGSVDDFLQWCRSKVAPDAPFRSLDGVLRGCLIPMVTAMDLPGERPATCGKSS